MNKQPESAEEKFMRSVFESCPAKAAMSCVAGGGLGLLIGLFMTSLDVQPPVPGEGQVKASTQQQVKAVLKEMGTKSLSSAKSFATVAAIYTGVECTIEGYRATNDLYNSASAGCVTGAILARKSGPRSMVLGCAGFAAFSTAIDYYMTYRE